MYLDCGCGSIFLFFSMESLRYGLRYPALPNFPWKILILNLNRGRGSTIDEWSELVRIGVAIDRFTARIVGPNYPSCRSNFRTTNAIQGEFPQGEKANFKKQERDLISSSRSSLRKRPSEVWKSQSFLSNSLSTTRLRLNDYMHYRNLK
jgi:hypothetical protein